MFIPVPASHRHAVAAEAGTTVLSFGGPPTFQPSAWEWAFQAAPLMRSDPARARQILAEGLRLYPQSASLLYGLACLEAVQGRHDAALTALRQAAEVAPDAADWARDEGDFAGLRDDPEFRSLVERPHAD